MTLTAALTAPLQGTGLLNGNWVIETVQGDFLLAKPYFGVFGHYRYTVKMVDIQQINSWLDFWKGMATGAGASSGVTGGPLVATSGGPLGTAPSVVGSPPIGSTTVSGTLGILAGATLVFKSGSNDRVGTGTLVAGTLAVGNTSVTANSLIFIQALGGGSSVGSLVEVSKTPGTGFTVSSYLAGVFNSADTQNFQYFIIETN